MKNNSTIVIWCFLLTLLVTISCSKEESIIDAKVDGVKLKVNLTRAILSDNLAVKNSNKSSVFPADTRSSKRLSTEAKVVSLANDINVVAELVPETESFVSLKQSTNRGLKSVASEVKTSLELGTRYRLLLFKDGEKVYEHDYTVQNQPHTFAEIDLGYNGAEGKGKGLNKGIGAYTLVAYSAGTEAIPQYEGNNLQDFFVTITEGHDKFMHFVQPLQVDSGMNNVDVVLENKLTEITTVVDGTNLGNNSIKAISSPRFEAASHSTRANNRATIKLLDGSMSYLGTADSKSIVFPTIPSAGITQSTSLPTILVHSATTAASLRFPITIQGPDGLLNKEISFDDIAITPGVKYKLLLRLNKGRCLIDMDKQEFTMGPQSGSGQTISRTFQFSAESNGGAVLDILKLDNSFNMNINGTMLATGEIDFQDDRPSTGPRFSIRTARFRDGAQHGEGGLGEIWQLEGTESAPLIRITISPDGQVTMEGSKTSGGPLYPMELFGVARGSSVPMRFNTVNWKTDGTSNQVVVNQLLIGNTEMRAFVGGKKIVDCNASSSSIN